MASTPAPTVIRPRAVTIATNVLYVVAGIPPIFALVQLALVDDLKRAAERTYAGTELAATAASDAENLVTTGLFGSVVSAAILVALSFFCGRGRNWARILVWLFAVGRTLSVLISVRTLGDGYAATKPAWFIAGTATTLAITTAGILAAAVLLAVPASRPFFRKSGGPQAPTDQSSTAPQEAVTPPTA
jgi:hypothetical protein